MDAAITVFNQYMRNKDSREAEARIKAMGGSVTSSVTRKTTYLVAGESAGSKLDTANRLGTEVLDEDAFLAMLDQRSTEPVN